ncbi:nucleotidyltransferase domain-containing protein [Patescibacteria group bacterium]|nr:nucleotidyltransferase domain-containing protein [Patescibacteria group bacterium]
MRLEFYPAEKLKKEILEIVKKYLDINSYRVFFFGSRVTGKGNERSDVDIGIEGAQPIPTKILFQIEEDIANLPLLYKIEIVDFLRVAPKFKEVASQHIELLN